MATPLAKLDDEIRRAGFKHLYPTERILVQNFAGGEVYETQPSAKQNTTENANPPEDSAVDHGRDWGNEREVRGDLLRMLCVHRTALAAAGPVGIVVKNARITGRLDLQMITLPFPITFQNCSFDNTPTFRYAQVPYLEIKDCFAPGFDGELLIDKNHLYMDGFHTVGEEVNLRNCHITGNLSCIGAVLSNVPINDRSGTLIGASGKALIADGAIVDGFVLLRTVSKEKLFHASGTVSLLGAQIRGDLDCSGGRFDFNLQDPSDDRDAAFVAERANVKGNVFLREGFHSSGTVRLQDIQIGGNLICEGATFEAKEKLALSVERGIIAGGARLTSDDHNQICRAFGRLSFVDTRIGGVLVTDEADFQDAELDLSDASAVGLSDYSAHRPPQNWPPSGKLHLKRFEYAAIIGGTENAEDRLEWLRRQPDNEFNTESYAELAKVLQQAGDEDGARLILRRMSELQEKRGHRFWYFDPMIWLQAAIGYGYRPILAVWYSVFLGFIGWIIYRRSYLAGSLMPTDKDAYRKVKDDGIIPSYYPRLSPFMMSVENSLPLVKLGQSDKWQPDPNSPSTMSVRYENAPINAPKWTRAQMLQPLRKACSKMLRQTGLLPGPTGMSVETRLSRFGTSPRIVRRFIWIQILLGWLFATLFVAGVTGLIKR